MSGIIFISNQFRSPIYYTKNIPVRTLCYCSAINLIRETSSSYKRSYTSCQIDQKKTVYTSVHDNQWHILARWWLFYHSSRCDYHSCFLTGESSVVTIIPSRFAKASAIQYGMYIGNVELVQWFFSPDTCVVEQQIWNKTKTQMLKVIREEWIWKKVDRARKKWQLGLTVPLPGVSTPRNGGCIT